MKRFVLISILLLAASRTAAQGAQPLEALKGPIDEVVHVLKDPQYQGEAGKESQRERIWGIINRVFDFTEMAKRTLARNWRKFTPAQRKAFSEVFAEFLGNNYIDRIQGGYQDERVVYVGEDMLTKDKAVVKTTILRESLKIPVAYSLILREGAWRVYDVNIEGVSLVKNYRTQFNRVLMRQSPEGLIDTLKKKIERQKKEREASDQASGSDPLDRFLLSRIHCALAQGGGLF